MKVYVLSSSNKSFDMEFGYNLLQNKLSFTGKPYEMSDVSGHIDLFSIDGTKVMVTSSIAKKEMYVGEPQNAPTKVETPYGKVSASSMVVYTTKSGSVYAFIPAGITPELV